MAKFCANCGAQLGENEQFCGSCGAKVEDFNPNNAAVQQNNVQPTQTVQTAPPVQPQQQYYQQPVQPAAPKGPSPAAVWIKGHKNLLIIAAAVIVLVVAAIIVLVNIFKYEVIDPKDIAAVQFYGVDTDGYADVTLNDRNTMREYYLKQSTDSKSAFDYDFYKENIRDIKSDKCSDYFNEELTKDETLEVWKKASDLNDADVMRTALLNKVKFKLDKTTGLKNGDKVKVSVVYDKDSLKKKNIKLSDDEFEVEVKGLNKAETVDMFKGVTLKTKGYSGAARLTYSDDSFNNCVYLDKKSAYKFIDYDYPSSSDSSKYYSNDDELEITATLDIYSDNLHKTKKGYWFKYDKKYYFVTDKKTTKKFKVSGLKAPQEVDVFSQIEINSSGVSPDIDINSASTKDDCGYSDAVRFAIEANDGLKTGDKYKVYAKVDNAAMAVDGFKASGEANATEEDFKNHYDGYYFTDDDGDYSYFVKEFSIDDNFAKYISTKEDAVAAEETLKPSFNSEIAEIKDRSYISVYKGPSSSTYIDVKKYKSFAYVNSYIAYTNAASVSYRNYVVRMYKGVYVDDDNKTHTSYFAVYQYNVMKKNGEYECSEYNMDYKVYTTPSVLKQDLAKDDSARYTVTQYKNTKG